LKHKVITLMKKNAGSLPENETWYGVAVSCGISPRNKKRALTDSKYKIKSVSRKAQSYWQSYLKQENRLKLQKQVFKDGKIFVETYTKQPEPAPEVNLDDFFVEKMTTNPHGGSWMKYKRKENFYTEEHLESLKEVLIKEIEPVKFKEPKKNNKKALFVYGSDKHIGALTKEGSIYTNKYDRQEIKNRVVVETLKLVLDSVDLYGTFEDLYIMDLGDALDGFNQKTTGGLRGHSAHTLPQQLNNREQHDFYVETHKILFDSLVKFQVAKNIFFVATSNSNHGGDFEYGAMRNLETYLNVKYPQIKTYISYKSYNHLIYGEHAIIFGHGKDDEDMRNGLPLVLNPKVEMVLSDYLRVNDLNKYNVTFVSGDLHQSAETYAKNFRYKKVLSQFGSSKWAHTNFGSGTPGVSYEVFFKESPVIIKQDKFFDIGNQSNTGIEFS